MSVEETSLKAENTNLRRLLAQAGLDATEHKVAEQLQRILLEEMHHRVKNTLAIVQSITSQSLRAAESVEQGRKAIENRLAALGRVHDMLMRTSWGGAKLETILKAATAPFDTLGGRQFLIQSTDIHVGSKATLPFAMTLNELCTNAVKYGALSVAEGRVEITTTLDVHANQFHLTWTESNGPPVKPPSRSSFGMRLIEQSFVGQFQGTARVRFEPAGVVCYLDVPLDVLQAEFSN